MTAKITGIVKEGVVVPSSPLPEGTRVEILPLMNKAANPLLHFAGHLDPNDALERDFAEELARRRREDLEQTLREDAQECPSSSSTPTT